MPTILHLAQLQPTLRQLLSFLVLYVVSLMTPGARHRGYGVMAYNVSKEVSAPDLLGHEGFALKQAVLARVVECEADPMSCRGAAAV